MRKMSRASNLAKKLKQKKIDKTIQTPPVESKVPPSELDIDPETKIFRTKEKNKSNEKTRKRKNRRRDNSENKGKRKGDRRRKVGGEGNKGGSPPVSKAKKRRGYFDWVIDGGKPENGGGE